MSIKDDLPAVELGKVYWVVGGDGGFPFDIVEAEAVVLDGVILKKEPARHLLSGDAYNWYQVKPDDAQRMYVKRLDAVDELRQRAEAKIAEINRNVAELEGK
jgi:hypothetical protein